MIGFLIFLIICSVLAIAIKDEVGSRVLSFLTGAFMILCIAGFIEIKEQNNTPTALDVYQGETTLEITYRDSIPIDSVVVFKDEI